MKLPSLLASASILSALSSPLSGAALQISGTIYTLSGFDGDTIADGSRVEVGYFLGIDSSKSPTTYSIADWNSFTLLDVAETENLFGFLPGGVSIDTKLDSETDFGVGEIPTRIGIRVFDNLESGRFNIFTTEDASAILELPSITPGDGSADLAARSASPTADADFVWMDSSNPFQTSIAVPEPSTALSGLLGLGLLMGRRNRR